MPKIDWTKLDKGTRYHLLDRMRERGLDISDMQALQEWIRYSTDVPTGKWFKDFGSFKLCGEGERPSTFLTAEQIAEGQELD